MLTRDETELLCRVGPGTPMGSLWREYWVPVLRSEALVAGGDPRRVRVFGENYAAFRSRDGRVAIVDEKCPHRGASLVLGRNEECGLRCLYHGWAISVEGKVVQTPNDPTFKRPDLIPVRHVPVREAGEMIWAWFGKGQEPAFPRFVFNQVPTGTHVRTTVGIVKANWLQLVENVLDPLHTAILHGPGNKENWAGAEGHPAANAGSPIYESLNTPPLRELPPSHFELDRTAYGFRYLQKFAYGGIGEGMWLPVVMPAWVFAAGAGLSAHGDRVIFGHTPIDDESTMLWVVGYNPFRPLGPLGTYHADTACDVNNFVPRDYDREHHWLQDRQAMAERRSYSGLGIGRQAYGVFLEDIAMCESMGFIGDRTHEHLCKADAAVVEGRRVYLRALREHMNGGRALGVDYDVARISLPDGPEYEPVAKRQTSEVAQH